MKESLSKKEIETVFKPLNRRQHEMTAPVALRGASPAGALPNSPSAAQGQGLASCLTSSRAGASPGPPPASPGSSA